MTVSIISSPTLGGAQYSDSLQGGGTGANFGSSEAGTTPSVKSIYVRHDGVSQISNLAIYLKAYSATYGGEYSASADVVKVFEQGLQSAGFQIDMNWSGVPFASFITMTTALGGSIDTAIEIPVTAILHNSGGTALQPSAPLQGELGAAGNSVLGNTVLLKCRWLVPTGEPAPGRRQIDLAYLYNFTT